MALIAPLSFIWLLSLSFYKFSLVGSLSLDNLLAPILFFLLVFGIFTRSVKLTAAQSRNLFWTGVTATVYLLAHSLNLLTTQSAVWVSIITVAKGMLYFFLPVMFINSEQQLKRANNAIIVVMLIGCGTALLQSLGLIHLSFARSAGSRFDLSGFEKSTGFLGSYGDVGMLTSLALLLVIGGRRGRVFFGRGSWIKILIVVAAALAGILAQQSRNLIFTVMVSIGAFVYLGHIRKRRNWRGVFYATLIGGVAVSSIIIVLYADTLIAWVQSIGGTKEAAATVAARLSQYKFGWSLVHDRLLTGADPAKIQSDQTLVTFIHNMWLKELVEGGLPAVAATMWFYIRAIRNQVSRYYDTSKRFEARAYLALLVGLLLATQFYPASTYIYWVLLGIATARPDREAATARAAPAKLWEPAAQPPVGLIGAKRSNGHG